MSEESNNNNLNPTPPSGSVAPPSMSGGEKVIQPSESIKQELQAQQIQPQVTQPTTTIPPNPQPNPVPNPASVYPEPTAPGQMQVGMSASQLGLHEPKSKLFDFNPKQLIIKGIVALVVLGAVFTALIMTNIIALSEFKSVGYTNTKGTSFNLDFYSKHGSKRLNSGNKQLVSKVSKDGKFPIALSISTDETSSYNRAKDCASFTKVFDVQNNNLNQKISVCDFGKQGNLPAGGVYIAGFMHNDKAHIVTIGQDYGDINPSSQSGAEESLTRFGMEPYKADIERIISSIKVE